MYAPPLSLTMTRTCAGRRGGRAPTCCWCTMGHLQGRSAAPASLLELRCIPSGHEDAGCAAGEQLGLADTHWMPCVELVGWSSGARALLAAGPLGCHSMSRWMCQICFGLQGSRHMQVLVHASVCVNDMHCVCTRVYACVHALMCRAVGGGERAHAHACAHMRVCTCISH